MVRIGSVVLNVSDTRRAARFWSQALGYVVGHHFGSYARSGGLGGVDSGLGAGFGVPGVHVS
jgi:catechol 2,3-dioxygenase-like lactoylglutathione lyase family enzyme